MTTRAFVTGATGFLGGALARALARDGVEVHAIARGAADRRCLADVTVTWHEGDVRDARTLRGLFRSADWIVHAAGRLGEAGVPEREYQETNVEGTRHVLAEALSGGAPARVLHLSSAGVVGPAPQPAAEDAPSCGTTPYERSKIAGEVVALEFARRGLPVVVARPAFVYGPGDRHVLGLFRAVRDGRFFYVAGGGARCQPTYVDDAVTGMIACLRRGRSGEAYHLAGPRPVSFRELGGAVAGALGVPPPRRSLPRWLALAGALALEGAARISGGRAPLSRTGVAFFSQDRVVSCAKAREELGYEPVQDLETGVPATVAWYRARGWL